MTQAFLRIAKDKGALLVTAFFLLSLIALWRTSAAAVGPLVGHLIASYFLLWGLAALLLSTPQHELRKRFLLLTVTLLFALAVMEVPGALGIVDYRSVFSTPSQYAWEEPGRVFDDELLWRAKPHYHKHVKYTRVNIGIALCLQPGPVREFDLRYDQNGFRNEEDFVTADIAIIGDSYVEAPMMEHSLIMTSVLAQLQKKTVVNLGMSGYGPQQELIVLKRYVPRLRSKTVVWLYYGGNDLHNVREYEKNIHLFTRKDVLPSLWDRSFVRNVLSMSLRLLDGCTLRPDTVSRYGIVQGPDRKQWLRYFVGTNSDLVPLDLRALESTRSIIKEAYHLSQEGGYHLVFAYAPDAFSVYNGLSNLIEVSDEVKRWKVSDLQDQLRAMVGEISPEIDYLDLTPDLKQAAEKGSRIFIEDDSHWTEEGHRVVAEAIHRLLSSHPPKD